MNSRAGRLVGVTSPDAARGQSAVIGMVLLLGFTVVVGSTIALTGALMVQSGQDSTEIGHAENEMAVLASKIAEVGLGDSEVQQTSFGGDDGKYEIREDVGTMTIEHVNRTPGSDSSETVYEMTLGAVVYGNGETEVAYQGGGVWKKSGDSTSMVSSPEFHYRDGTLTLPMVSVAGDGRASGGTDVVIRPGNETRTIYPNPSDSYDDGDSYANPVENGTVRVTVEGDYYKGWKQYFEERTTGTVSVDESEESVSVDLVTLGDQGETDLDEHENIVLRGLPDEDPLDDFTLHLVANEHNSADFNNLDWNLEVDGEPLVNLKKTKGSGSPPHITASIYDGSGDSWEVNDPYETNGEEAYINLTGEREMTHPERGTEEIGDVFNERIEEIGPDVDLAINEGNKGNGKGSTALEYDGDSSTTVDIEFDGEGRIITFLQITENEVEIEFN